ncbi:MAG: AMP-binding enzyme [Homavirus sp.]|uniref:AMP-binding enzyme n=1 Tax=Homavirus sp. TaxID=2487769 RepID=A0A3G5A6C6_9VIRU|nr:MAG: AMP-binding enzyme [Homavirus sp.]
MDYLFYIIILIIIVLLLHHRYNAYSVDKNRLDKMKFNKVNFDRHATIIDIFKDTVKKYPNNTALVFNKNPITYRKYYQQCNAFCNTLKYYNINKGSRVCIMGYNSPEWFYSHLGCMIGGVIPVGIYFTSQEKTCTYIINHCNPTVLVVADFECLDKFKDVLNQDDFNKNVIEKSVDTYNNEYLDKVNTFNDNFNDNLDNQNNQNKQNKQNKQCSVKYIIVYGMNKLNTNNYNEHIKIYTWDQFLKMGSNTVLNASPLIDNKNIATIIYTSGTTGDPKGVVLSHHNIYSTLDGLVSKFNTNNIKLEQGNEVIVSYLPLNHIAGQMMDIYIPICTASTVWIADRMALKGTLVNTLQLAQPTIFSGVPRVWEKIYENIDNKKQQMPFVQRMFIDLANNITNIPNRTIINKLGLGRCKYRITMAAPLSQDIKDFFADMSMPLYEVYGMSETCGPITACMPNECKYKSVGKPLKNTNIKIAKDGEIIVRSPSIFSKYYKSQTPIIDNQGYFHTGDMGHVDKDGYLFITGRKKELIITAGGENIAPIEIENNIKHCLPIISYAVVVGDQMKYLSVLLVLKMEPDTVLFSKQTQQLLKSIGSKCTDTITAEDDDKIKKYINDGIQCANKLATSNAHHIKKWKIVPNSFSIKTGELTPTMKLKRNYITKKYKYLIDQLYL